MTLIATSMSYSSTPQRGVSRVPSIHRQASAVANAPATNDPAPLQLPVEITPTEEQFAQCIVIDSNGDGKTFTYDAAKNAFQTDYSAAGITNDDWLILPAFAVGAGDLSVKIEFEAAIKGSNFPDEEMSVWVSTSPDAASMTTCLVEPFTPMDGETSEFQSFSVSHRFDAPGVYYLGFHNTSAPDMFGMYLKNIRITANKESGPQPMQLPVDIIPTEEQFNQCTVIDCNGDGKTFTYDPEKKAFQTDYSAAGVTNDDWLILPPFAIEDGERFIEIEFEAAIKGSSFPDEEMSVWIGTSPDIASMTTCLVEPFTPMDGETSQFQSISALHQFGTPGTYYLGFHNTSAPDMFGMYLKNIRINDNNVSDTSPGPVTELKAESAPLGELKATVTFTFPVKTFAGDDLPADCVLTAKVSDEVDIVELSGKGGETVSTQITTVQGDNTIDVTVALGDKTHPAQNVSVYTGIAVPATPYITDSYVTEDMLNLVFTWDPVTEAAVPGRYAGNNITYTVYYGLESLFGIMWEPVRENITETSCTFALHEGDPMEHVYAGVASFNEAGTNGMIYYTSGILGTPYTLPMDEDISDAAFSYHPWEMYAPTPMYTAQWHFEPVWELVDVPGYNETYCFASFGNAGEKAGITMPRFSTNDVDECKFAITAYSGNKSAPITLTADYKGNTGSPVEIGQITRDSESEEIITYSFMLPEELKDKDWVEINIISSFDSASQVALFTRVAVTAEKSGIATVSPETQASVRGAVGGIEIDAAKGTEIAVYDIKGMFITKVEATGETMSIHLPAGLYIVRVGQNYYKIKTA